MGLARSLLLRASRSPRLARAMANRAFVARAVRRFMPGEELDAALKAARALAPAGIAAVFTRLGENVATLGEAETVRDHYAAVLARIRAGALPAHISVKLTQLGLDLDRGWCEEAVLALAEGAAGAGSFVWIDMEDSHYTDATLEVYRRVRARAPGVGVCLQAYLRRTPADLETLLPLAPAIRVVKGAYAEPPEAAYPRKRDVDDAYLSLATRLLERAAARAAKPVFGTHDMRLVAAIRERARSVGVAPGGYEFHQLYGIRATDQHSLAAAGEHVRVLVSYGSAWFAWYMRRLAERPANVWFALRALLSLRATGPVPPGPGHGSFPAGRGA